MNKVMLIGVIYSDPRTIKNFTRFSLKVEREFKEGQFDFLIIEFEGTLSAEFQKGCSVVVFGELRRNSWTTNEGVQKDETIIRASKLVFLNGA